MGRAPTKTLSATLATSALIASALLVAPAAFAAEKCDGKTVTKVVSSGTYEGTSGQDVVIVKGQATVKLGAGSDTVCVQTDGRVTAYLGEGQDKFFGAGKKGHHWVHGGPGRNDIYVGNGGSLVLAGDSGDVIVGGSGIDNVVGGSGHDDIKGGDGDDTLYGLGGIDLIKGGKGDDLIVGGLDRDELYGDAGNDTIYGDYDFTEGEDVSWVGTGDEGKKYAAKISAGYGNDKLYGGAGNDKLVGDLGDDYLDGGRGDDYLEGGPGSDQLFTGIDIKKSDGAWEQVKGDTLIGDYYETRDAGGFAWDNDVLASSPGDDRDEENRPGVVKAVYGGAGDDSISVWGLNSMKIKNAAVVIERQGESWINAGPGKDNVTAFYVQKVEGKDGNDTIKAVDVETVYGNAGKDLFQLVKWGHAYGGKGVDTFDMCQAPEDPRKHGYTWGEQELDKFIGVIHVYYAHPNDSAIVADFRHYQAGRAATHPSSNNYTLDRGESCPAERKPQNVKMKPLNQYFKEFDTWAGNRIKQPGNGAAPPDPWY